MKTWTSIIQAKPELLREVPSPLPNKPSVRKHPTFATIFQMPIPDVIPGFECVDAPQMEKLYPAGSDAADEVHTVLLAFRAQSTLTRRYC